MRKHLPPLEGELPASLYIHVPFCVRKCLYCDFVSYSHNPRDEREYLKGLGREMALWAKWAKNERWTLSTVFVGGGTPTCLSQDGLGEIILLINRYFYLSRDAEFTVEVNPGTVDRSTLAALRRSGVNRLSLGAQACCAKTLRTLGRIHTHGQTVEAVRWTREAGFDNLNVDLIHGVPGQSPAGWRRCLEQVIDLRPDHVSAYGLQLEPGTPLCTMVEGGLLQACSEDLQLEMYFATMDILESAGLHRYEISNFARPGRECRHNLVYWHNGRYLGLGPAAHSRLGMRRIANHAGLADYRDALSRGVWPVSECQELRPADDMFETVFLGLRMAAGLDLERFRERYGRSLDELYPGLVARLTGHGLLEKNRGFLRLTRRGLAVANAVMAEFVPLTNS